MELNGIFLINKEKGLSSRKIDDLLNKKFNIKKSGHLGTLDPFASGLLIIAVNKATKLLQFINDDIKEYIAVLKLGDKTETFDTEGEIIEKKPITKFSENDILNVFKELKSITKMVPPIFSAIKFKGKKLYEYALKKKEINLKNFERDVKIYDLKLISFTNDEIKFRCIVSKGTYIRSLGVLIAEKLNNIGYLTSLERTKIGNFNLSEAKTINEVQESDLIPYNKILTDYFKVKVDDKIINIIKCGKKFYLNGDLDIYPDKILIVDKNDNYLAIYKYSESNIYLPFRGLF